MRVTLLGPYPPPHGGVESHVIALRTFLIRQGVNTAVINLTRHRKEEEEEVYYPKTAGEVIRRLVQMPSDICHLHYGGNLSFRLLGLAFFCSMIPNKKTLLTLHSGGYPLMAEQTSRWMRLFRRLIFRRLDGIVGVNAQLVEMFLQHGVDRDKVRLIAPHAIDTEARSVGLSDQLSNFAATHRPLLVTISQLEPEYDLPLQIGMLGDLLHSWPQAGLVILGSGSLAVQLKQFIMSKSYSSHILLGGDVPHEEVLSIIAEGDVLLRTTWYDGDSIAVREALALGTPVVATDNGMRPDGVTLIPARNPAALRGATMDVLGRGPSGKNPVVPGRKDENLRKVLDFYHEILGGVGS